MTNQHTSLSVGRSGAVTITPLTIAIQRWGALESRADQTVDDESDAAAIGERDGFSEAVQMLDWLTGGDGEYRYCSNHDPERHCPDPAFMMMKIVDRFAALRAQAPNNTISEETGHG